MGNLLAHPRTKIPKKACESDEPACDEVGARELGLKNNLKQAEVNALIQYYQRRDPDNDGLLPEEFKEAAGEFIASGLTIDPTVIFNIFDTGAGGIAGRVTLREFILGYAILCRGSAESRLKYLFAIFGDADRSDYLTREQLISSLKLMQRIVSEVSEYQDTPDEENEMQIMTVADTLIAESSESESKRISYGDFIEKLREDEVVNTWLDELSSVAGEHLKYIDKREVDVVELNMEREGLLHAGSTSRRPSFRGMDWTPSPEEPLEAPSAERPPADKKRRIPMPKKQKLVRRDLRRSSLEESAWSPKPDENDDDTYNEGNAARPFVINYDQIEFGKILGRGACATVYKCQWMHVPVAVKVFNDGHGEAAGIDKLATTNEEVRKNVVGDYVEEFWLLLQIRHPNCLLYMGICFEPVVCIVTELYSGGSVANYLHGPNPRKFSPEKALEILCGVARGMYYLHASSPPILHRDLKASNILINQSLTHCVICDFGLSSQFVNEASGLNLHPSRGMSDAGVGGIGTPYTMAPEIMRRNTYKPAADVYSFGIVMYEVYTSRFPYPNMKPIQLMFHVTEKHRPKFYEEDNVPPTMRTLIEKCWSQDPKDRPTFEEILGVLTSSQLENEIFERYRSLITTEPGKQTSNMSLESTPDDLSKNLLEAVYRGQNSIVAQLIDRGANVNYSDYDKRTALHVGKLYDFLT